MIVNCVMDRAALVPHQHITLAPPVMIDEFRLDLVFEEELQQWSGLLPGHPLKTDGVKFIYVKRLAASIRMRADDRMGLRREVGIVDAVGFTEHTIFMESAQAAKYLLKLIRERLVRDVLVCEHGVAAIFRKHA